LVSAQRRIAAVWLAGSGSVAVVLMAQTITGRFGHQMSDAWGWFLPTVMPTLSLMIAVIVSDARTPPRGSVDRFVYRLAVSLSGLYLVTVAVTLVLSPLAEFYTGMGVLELMRLSHLWLAPFQGLVTAAIGALFSRREVAAGSRT
jgi:hypothetical protein